MRNTVLRSVSIVLAMGAGAAFADPDDDQLVINDEIEIITEAAAPDHLDGAMKTIYSGWRFRADETQALEMVFAL